MATSQVMHVCATHLLIKIILIFTSPIFFPSAHANLIALPALTEERNRHM